MNRVPLTPQLLAPLCRALSHALLRVSHPALLALPAAAAAAAPGVAPVVAGAAAGGSGVGSGGIGAGGSPVPASAAVAANGAERAGPLPARLQALKDAMTGVFSSVFFTFVVGPLEFNAGVGCGGRGLSLPARLEGM